MKKQKQIVANGSIKVRFVSFFNTSNFAAKNDVSWLVKFDVCVVFPSKAGLSTPPSSFSIDRWISLNSGSISSRLVHPRNQAKLFLASSRRFWEMSQWGLSGMKKRQMKATAGRNMLAAATVRQWKNLPSRNCASTPPMTAMVLVEDSIPRKWGWVTSATYVNT